MSYYIKLYLFTWLPGYSIDHSVEELMILVHAWATNTFAELTSDADMTHC